VELSRAGERRRRGEQQARDDPAYGYHGRRLLPDGLRAELRRAAAAAGIAKVTPHQLRHTYATALVNAGVSLQALMAILGWICG